jgi:hypothetical protein
MRNHANERVARYRKRHPEDKRSDEEIYAAIEIVKTDSRYQEIMIDKQVAEGLISSEALARGNIDVFGNYTYPIKRLAGEVLTVKAFREKVAAGSLFDWYGFAQPVNGEMTDMDIHIPPQRLYKIPKDATHVIWFEIGSEVR